MLEENRPQFGSLSCVVGLLVIICALILLPSNLNAEDPDAKFLNEVFSGTQSQAAAPKTVTANIPRDDDSRNVSFRPVSRSIDVEDANRVRKSNQASKRNIGSARMLEGTVHVQHVFLSDRTTGWTEFERQQAMHKMKESYTFINLHARRFNKKVRFVDEIAKDVKIDGHIPRDAHADPKWTEYALSLGQDGSAGKAVARIKQDTNPDSVVLCLHVNKSALSYNLAYYRNVTRCYAAERMVCFTSYPDGRETSSATYAHEVLHLFGAGDLYFPYDRTDERKKNASQLFPNDVMFRVDYDIYQLNVGQFTAYRIGWQDKLQAKYRFLED